MTQKIPSGCFQYAHRVHTAKRRAQTLPPGTRVVRANNNTVIYTIPTTQQLATTYPSIGQTYNTQGTTQNGTTLPPAYGEEFYLIEVQIIRNSSFRFYYIHLGNCMATTISIISGNTPFLLNPRHIPLLSKERRNYLHSKHGIKLNLLDLITLLQ